MATLAIVAASVLGLDVAVAVSLRHHLDGGLRHRLPDRAALAVDLGPGRAERRREELSGDGIEARVLGRPPASAAPAPAAPSRRVARIQATGAQFRITQDIGGGMTVVLLASRAPVTRAVRGLVLIEALGSLVLLAVAGLGVRVVVRAALRPLDAVVATAARIAGGASGERLRPDRPDTELGRLAGAFDTMVEALERSAARAVRAEETMRRFLEDAGHELRTPAANISASAEALLRGDCRRHEREELEVAMIRESQRMGRLVTDIVDLAQGRAPDPAPATVDLAAVVRREAAQLRHRHPDLTVDVDCPPTAAVPGDEMALTRLVGNLLDNAANASPPAGRVAARVRVRETGARTELVVTDTGPGIPAGERERIFERFVRLEPSRSRDSGGSGLGLPIARSIARAHGGDVTVTDARVGARFVAWLPARPAVPAPAGGEGSGPAPGPEPDHDSQLSTCLLQSSNSQEL